MTREEFMDIVYYELDSDDDNYRANRIIDAADEYAEEQTRWIPVSERLPEDRQKVLLTVGNIFYVDDTYNTVEIYWYIKDKNAFVNRDNEVAAKPIAWMPSPETYKASPTGAEGRCRNE